MEAIANRVANEYWEANLPVGFEGPNLMNCSQMANFVWQKYGMGTERPPSRREAGLPELVVPLRNRMNGN
jgi:hypothetical protein